MSVDVTVLARQLRRLSAQMSRVAQMPPLEQVAALEDLRALVEQAQGAAAHEARARGITWHEIGVAGCPACTTPRQTAWARWGRAKRSELPS